MDTPTPTAGDPRLLRALSLLSTVLERQREAAIHGDSVGLNRALEALAQLMVEVETLADETRPGFSPDVAAALQGLRRQVTVNRVLSHNGMAAADHWVGVRAEKDRLFQGVA